jgi:hypothetical protein
MFCAFDDRISMLDQTYFPERRRSLFQEVVMRRICLIGTNPLFALGSRIGRRIGRIGNVSELSG